MSAVMFSTSLSPMQNVYILLFHAHHSHPHTLHLDEEEIGLEIPHEVCI